MRVTGNGTAEPRRTFVVALAALIVALGAVPPAAAGGPKDDGGDGLDALVLDGAASPVLSTLRDVSDLDTVSTERVKRRRPGPFELLIVDGDTTTPRALRRNSLINRFVGAGRWIATFDLRGTDQGSVATRTGFDTEGPGPDRSELVLFRIANVEGTPTIEIVDSGPLAAGARKQHGKRRARELRSRHAARVARLVDERLADPDEARAAAVGQVACPSLDPAPNPDLQHIGWCFTDIGQRATNNGFWTQGQKRWWMDSYAGPGSQTATWTMNHRFDVFLDNDPAHPRGNFNTVTYALNGQFSPKRPSERFFRMEEEFTSGWHGRRVLERAWWTGAAEVAATPLAAPPSNRLVLEGSHPANANAETQYTSGEEFSVGFSGTAARPDAGLGVGLSLSYSSSNSKSHSIPDWGVENRSSGEELRWLFNARQPCDTRPNRDRAACFDRNTFFIGPYSPARPSDLSRGLLQVNTSGRWRTRTALGEDQYLTFGISTPVTLVDTYCDGEFIGGWCGDRHRYTTNTTGPAEAGVKVDAWWVSPIPIKAVRLSPDPANGARNEKVTGKVVLEEKARVPVNVRIVSNSDNAVVGAPFPGVAGGSQGSVTIDPGKDTGTFTVATNDNRLSPGQRTTASITAFYTEATTEQLRILKP